MKTIQYIFFLILLAFVSCGEGDSTLANTASDTGVAGSYARFMVVGDYMYVVDDSNLNTYDLANPALPVFKDKQAIGNNIESIYNLNNRLFIGSGEGLFIYTIGNDGVPQKQGAALYDFPIYPCDPVVANETYAYVTLSTTVEGACGRAQQFNQLIIYDVQDITSPSEVATYEMQNPKGVGLDGDLLFVCENQFGLKFIDVSDPENIQVLLHIEDIMAYDVIPLDGLLLVVGPSNVYQYDYSDLNNIQLISSIPIQS